MSRSSSVYGKEDFIQKQRAVCSEAVAVTPDSAVS